MLKAILNWLHAFKPNHDSQFFYSWEAEQYSHNSELNKLAAHTNHPGYMKGA